MEPTTGRENENVDRLNQLLRSELSAVETYRLALEKINDANIRATLEDNRRLHALRCDLLKNRILAIGGKPDHTSGLWGAFAKLMQAGAKLLGTKTAIAALEEGEDRGLREYRESVLRLDAETRQFVESQLIAGQESTHRAVSGLKHTLH
jgi:demethoxyubiquinone hydroxylase (CLK1/Coq7/Cat5 family)